MDKETAKKKAKADGKKLIYMTLDKSICAEHPHLIAYRRGDNVLFYNYNNGVYEFISNRDMTEIIDNMMVDKGIPEFRTVAKRRDTMECISATLAHIGRQMTDQKVDAQEWRINLKNGLFDPKIQTLETHTPLFFSTVQVPFAYDKDAQAPMFKEFIEKVSGGDTEIAQMLQEVFGYCLLDGNPKHKVFYFYGNTARNGKSTTAKILSGLIGNGNVSALSLGQLGNDNSSILMSLMGKQLNFSDEISTKYIESPRLISLSSEGVIEVNPKYKDTFTCKIKAKFIIACNDMPRFQDAQGMNHRLHVVPFNVQIPPNERIDRYDEVLLAKEGAGILNWAIQGLQLFLLNNKLTVSKQSEEEAEYSKLESDPFRAYLEEYFAFSDDYEEKIYLEDLYGEERTKEDAPTMFRGYCARSGIKTPSIHTMSRQLRRFADETKKIKQKKEETGKRFYVGLKNKALLGIIISQPSPYGTKSEAF